MRSLVDKKTKLLLRKENKEYFNKLALSRKVYAVFSVAFPSISKKIYNRRLNVSGKSKGYASRK